MEESGQHKRLRRPWRQEARRKAILCNMKRLLLDFVDLSENGLKFRMDQENDILTLPIHRVRTLTSRMGDVIYPKPIHLKR